MELLQSLEDEYNQAKKEKEDLGIEVVIQVPET